MEFRIYENKVGLLSITWAIAKLLFPINLKFMGKGSYAF
jgi:hypothetical protein